MKNFIINTLRSYIKLGLISLFTILCFNINFSFAQCACVSIDCNGDLKCIIFTNCGGNGSSCASNDNFGQCMQEACNPSCGNNQTSCYFDPMMGSCNISGPSPSNGACWYSTGQCDADSVCAFVQIITLPVRLIDFYATEVYGQNFIEWETASETNCKHYTLLHSVDGKNYSQIISLSGAGTSGMNNSYDAVHADPDSAINYYKLLTVDYDGRSTAYGPISIDNRDQKRKLVKVCNMLGQEVNENYRGIVIYHYSDGTYEKIYK